jgi:cell division protein FtsQ
VIPENPNLPSARSWRDISQPVKTRAMSRGGRLRLVLAGARTVAVAAFVAGLAWGGWTVFEALQHDGLPKSASAKTVPLKAPELQTTRDGVLDNAWLVRTLRLPAGVSLIELDLASLRERLLADRQVLSASLTRHFPDRLTVQITERNPIARVRLMENGAERDFLAAIDGVVYLGSGYDPGMLRTLPWLDGMQLSRDGTGFRATVDLDPVARLLAAAQYSAPHLYRTWQSVSLARLAIDREVEVTNAQGLTVVFNAKGEYFPQLARLDYVLERRERLHSAGPGRIDLSLGREVPFTIEPVAAETKTGVVKAQPTNGNSNFQLRIKREL